MRFVIAQILAQTGHGDLAVVSMFRHSGLPGDERDAFGHGPLIKRQEALVGLHNQFSAMRFKVLQQCAKHDLVAHPLLSPDQDA